MWTMIPSLGSSSIPSHPLSPSPPSPPTATSCSAWVMCLGKHTLCRVAHTAHPERPPTTPGATAWTRYYNFFERSAWTPTGLAYRVGRPRPHPACPSPAASPCWSMTPWPTSAARASGAWAGSRDAVASTRKRVATASGHNWVVVAVAFRVPVTSAVILALPLLARLHLPGKGQPSCAAPGQGDARRGPGLVPRARRLPSSATGLTPARSVLADLPAGARSSAGCAATRRCTTPSVPQAEEGQARPQGQEGAAAAQPEEAAEKADRKRTAAGDWLWQEVSGDGLRRPSGTLQAVSYEAVWPHGVGAAADPGGGGARPGGADGRRLPVHDGPGGDAARG